MRGRLPLATLFVVVWTVCLAARVHAHQITVTVQADAPGKPISPDLFGIFFEDINYAADGGLYAEQVQNRSFEYSANDAENWNALTSWQLVQHGEGRGSVTVETASPLNARNPHYAVVTVEKGGAGVGLQNEGFDGIVLKAGDKYDLSLFARQLAGPGGPLSVRLESQAGVLLGEATLPRPAGDWEKYTATIKARQTVADARLVVLAKDRGRIALDMVSLFPRKTFHNRPNGLRADLAQTIADLKPKFVRFPGGCLVHGDGLANMYRWKTTVGPLEERLEQRNIWNYHQTVGLGYYEYFQFCEDIGAKPLPVVPAGVCCQNSNYKTTHKWGIGQKGLPMTDMPAYVQEVLDLIDYANGPTSSAWGAKRAAAGHPKPFHLQYLGVGNEEHITPVFKERFQMIYEAVKAKHPEITVIGTVGPFHSGDDFEEGWKIANGLKLPMVDEHYYERPEWFLSNLKRYETYDRARSKVYVGEYAAHDTGRTNTLRSALAEAAYLTSLERNGDVVRLASYAPLLAKQGHTQWRPDLIYFNNTNILLSVNYYVQQMFGRNQGDVYMPTTVASLGEPTTQNLTHLAVSCVQDSKTGDIILKLVNADSAPVQAQVSLERGARIKSEATRILLTGDPKGFNTFGNPRTIVPLTSKFTAGKQFTCEAPPCSLTVIRMKTSGSQ